MQHVEIEEETAEYILCHYEELDGLCFLQIGAEKPTTNNYTKKDKIE